MLKTQSSSVTVVLGSQWGDEGKGKIVDMLAEQMDIVARCQVPEIGVNILCCKFEYYILLFSYQILYSDIIIQIYYSYPSIYWAPIYHVP